jgi:hypothetical protein
MRTAVYECEVCGSEITVSSDGLPNISPIYCCGVTVAEKQTKSSGRPASAKGVKQRVKKATVKKKASAGRTASGTAAKKTRKR